MNQKYLIAIVGLTIVLIGIAGYVVMQKKFVQNRIGVGNTPCTQEAKLCPDGSYVGRTGPNCEFSACPDSPASGGSGIFGTVLLGPTCPIQRIPPDPKCADKPYRATLAVMTPDRKTEVTRFTSNAAGEFRITLPPGQYTIASLSSMPPTCTASFTVEANKFTNVNVSCDTGIR